MCLLNKHFLLREYYKRVTIRLSTPSSALISPPTHRLTLLRALSAPDYNYLFFKGKDGASVKHMPKSHYECSKNFSCVNKLDKY